MRVRWTGALALLALLWPGLAAAQAPSPLLAPPALPPSLPGGAALPVLPPAAQAEILQRILDAAGGRAAAPAPAARSPAPAADAPAMPAAAPPVPPLPPGEPLSPVEAFFAARLELPAPLRQFGHDQLRAAARGTIAFGLLPDDYVLGRDDEVLLTFRGRNRQSLSQRVLRDGTLVVPDLPPIAAAGRTLAELRVELEQRAARDLGSEVFVSIGQVRQIAVFVGGEVERPGQLALTALSSVLDALVAAGGLRRSGSLRAIRVEGPRGARMVDLYPVVAGIGAAPDLSLREGERILVPPLGGVVAIGGEVTRPGLYELPAGAAQAPLAAMLSLAGEALRPGGNRFLLQGSDGAGRRSFREIGARDALRRGDALLVQAEADVVANRLRLVGHVVAPLTRASGRGATLRSLLPDPRLLRPDPYLRLAMVWRVDGDSRARRFEPFDLGQALQRGHALPLQEGDEVIILAQTDVLWLSSPAVQRALRGEAASGGPDCPALAALAVAARASPQRFAHARGAGFPDIGAQPCPQLLLDYPTLLPVLLDATVLLTGEVRLPGLYPIAGETGVEALLAVAGGMTAQAEAQAAELTREATAPIQRRTLNLGGADRRASLQPRDALRIPRQFGDRDLGPVTLMGEFMRPGVYDIRRGERLSELMTRAGGLTPQAYPYGAVFTRESVRERQQEGLQRTAREVEQGLMQVASGQALAGLRGGTTDIGGAISAGRQLAESLRAARAAGRLVIEANPALLAAQPELDVLLEPGDLLAMPKRPGDVTVVGAVLNAGGLQFLSGQRAADYVRAAGGLQRFADPSRAFIVLPNGSAVPAGLSAWQFGGPPVPPGAMVVVPQDPSPYEGWSFLRDATQALSQVALSAAALAVIVRTGSRN